MAAEKSERIHFRPRNAPHATLAAMFDPPGSVALCFQPLVSLSARRIIGFTAHSIRPGDDVLRAASRAAARWPDGIILGVELSPARWHDPSTGLRVLGVLGETGLAPARLELEISDNVLAGSGRVMCRSIEELRQAGVMVALTGCGLRSDISAPPVCFDTLKIADTVIGGLGHDRISEGTVDALIALATEQGAVAAAAGIATEKQLTLLETKGCVEGQGSLFGKPAPAANIGAMLRYPSIAAAVA